MTKTCMWIYLSIHLYPMVQQTFLATFLILEVENLEKKVSMLGWLDKYSSLAIKLCALTTLSLNSIVTY